MSELTEASFFGLPPRLQVGLMVGAVYSISRFSAEFDTSTPVNFDQSVTLANFWWPSTCYFNQCNIFLINNFYLVLQKKFLEKINEKIQNFHKIFTFPPLFYTDCQFIQIAKQHLQKCFVLHYWNCSSVIKLLNKTTKDKHT